MRRFSLLRTTHSFIFSKLRLITHHNFVALRSHFKELQLTIEKKFAALEARHRESEQTLKEKLAMLEANYKELEQIQEKKLASLITHYQQQELVQQKKIAMLEAACAELEKRSFDEEAVQNGLSISIGLNCRNIRQLLQKEKVNLNMPYLESPLTVAEQLHQLKELEPHAFDLWWQCFLNGEKEYARSKEGNLSYGAHPGAAKFNRFVIPWLQGNVLDIGCGPQLLPTYFHGAINNPDIHLFGIDPLEGDHPFEFYRGFAEFLPWQANCFDVIICATSLDHCLSLSKTLDEIKRVLKPGGKCLIWVGFIPGAKAYEPKSQTLLAVDNFHLFHFDRPWFEDLLASYFSLIQFETQGPEGCFYVFEN